MSPIDDPRSEPLSRDPTSLVHRARHRDPAPRIDDRPIIPIDRPTDGRSPPPSSASSSRVHDGARRRRCRSLRRALARARSTLARLRARSADARRARWRVGDDAGVSMG